MRRTLWGAPYLEELARQLALDPALKVSSWKKQAPSAGGREFSLDPFHVSRSCPVAAGARFLNREALPLSQPASPNSRPAAIICWGRLLPQTVTGSGFLSGSFQQSPLSLTFVCTPPGAKRFRHLPSFRREQGSRGAGSEAVDSVAIRKRASAG